MSGKVFVDTNILVYAYDSENKTKQHRAREALLKLEEAGSGVISMQVIQEFYVTVTKKLGMQPLKAKQIIASFNNFEVVSIDIDLIKEAIDIGVLNQVSFWDALVIACAQSAGCSKIWTEDLTHSQAFKSVHIEHIL